WRVLRLDDPMAEGPPPGDAETPTLLIVDDAHLTRPAFLRSLEDQATATHRVLSAHTIAEGKENTPGTIQLDAKRAVRVIADGLRAVPEATAPRRAPTRSARSRQRHKEDRVCSPARQARSDRHL